MRAGVRVMVGVEDGVKVAVTEEVGVKVRVRVGVDVEAGVRDGVAVAGMTGIVDVIPGVSANNVGVAVSVGVAVAGAPIEFTNAGHPATAATIPRSNAMTALL